MHLITFLLYRPQFWKDAAESRWRSIRRAERKVHAAIERVEALIDGNRFWLRQKCSMRQAEQGLALFDRADRSRGKQRGGSERHGAAGLVVQLVRSRAH